MRRSTLLLITIITTVLLGAFVILALTNQGNPNNTKTEAVINQSETKDSTTCKLNCGKCDHNKELAELSQKECNKDCKEGSGEKCKKHCEHHKSAETKGLDKDSVEHHTHTE